MKPLPSAVTFAGLAIAIASPTGAFATAIEFQAHLEGAEEGPNIVVTAPEHRKANELGLAEQLAAIEIERGSLLLLTAAKDTPVEDTMAFINGYLGGDPDLLLINHLAMENYPWLDVPEDAPAIAVSREGDLLDLAPRFFGETVTTHVDTELAAEGSGATVALLLSHDDERISRQGRWSRVLATAALHQAGMTPEPDYPWSALTNPAGGELIGLYDAEGIGGLGPQRVELALADQEPDMRVARLCGEDIREGALDAFSVGVFPGGSGRGIVEALEPEGTEIVRDFVSSGGGFLGICAGAYAAGNGIDVYFGIMPLAHAAPWRRGSDHIEVELTPEGIALYGEEFTTFTTRYNNGPVFLETQEPAPGKSEVTVLATFKTPSTDNDGVVREEMVGTPAMGVSTFGQGKVLFISPHPETHPELYSIISDSIVHILPERSEDAIETETGEPYVQVQ